MSTAVQQVLFLHHDSSPPRQSGGSGPYGEKTFWHLGQRDFFSKMDRLRRQIKSRTFKVVVVQR